MSKALQIGEIELYWLNGGAFKLDGGAMFGAVPKSLWSEVYPPDQNNCIQLLCAPLLIKTPDTRVLVETGLGNKLTNKQKTIYQVNKKWDLRAGLAQLGLKRQDINVVVLTHCDFDHAGGIVIPNEHGQPTLFFPNATHIIQRTEWQDVQAPNLRSANTYWPENFDGLADSGKLQLIDGNHQVCEGVMLLHTGGHSKGHQIVKINSTDAVAYHLGDLLPTHLHSNPLWIMAYDNFPLKVIQLKQELLKRARTENAWLTLYHDPFLRACRFDDQGAIVDRCPPPVPQKDTPTTQKAPAPDMHEHIQEIHVGSSKTVTLGCPDCAMTRSVPVDKYMGRKHFLSVKCTCGTTFGVNLNFRQHYRKDVTFGGFFGKKSDISGFTEVGDIPTVPINCRIKNISKGGLGFSPLRPIAIEKGDTMLVRFTLDKQPPEVVEKEVVVKTVQGNYIGCEFTSTSTHDRTLGFYLMK